MKTIITGFAGQTGSSLAEFLLDNVDCEVHGIVRYRSDLSNVVHIKDKVLLHDCELRDAYNVNKIISKVKPDRIFHLAATSFVRSSFDQPSEVINNNVNSQINILNAVKDIVPDCKVQIASTSECYGKVFEDEIPIKESNALRPLSPYGVSKVAQENIAYQYHLAYGLNTYITRTFNHFSHRRGDAFVESSFCRQAAEAEAGLREPTIYHGNLDSVRDYSDARDIARAYWLATERCRPGEPYNISSNKCISIGEVLETIKDLCEVPLGSKVDPNRLRPSDVVLLHGDSSKFRDETGWEPEITFEQSIKDLLNYWRFKIKIIKEQIEYERNLNG